MSAGPANVHADWVGGDLVYKDASGNNILEIKSTGVVNVSQASKLQSGGTAFKGFIPLNITTARTLTTNAIVNLAGSGGMLAADSDPILERTNAATDKALRVSWASASVKEITFPSVPYPPDLDDTANVIVHLLAVMKAGSVNTPVLTVSAFESVGDTDFGSATAALSTTIQDLQVTLTGANVGTYPNFLTLGVTPGAHATGSNDIYLYAAWIEYTRK